MDVLVIGDLHLRGTDLDRQTEMLNRILDHLHSHDYRLVVVLGDTLDRFDLDAQVRAVDFLSCLHTRATTYLLIGNHDRPHNREYLTNRHPFAALKHWGPTMVVVETVVEALIDDHWFVFVPYVAPGLFSTALALAEHWSQARCIFAHQEFRGARDGSHQSTKGDGWSSDAPLVVSGHIHEYQLLQRNLLYAGTPIHHHFGERGDRGLIRLHLTADTWSYEQLPLGIPNKIQLDLPCDAVDVISIPLVPGTRVRLVGTAADQRSRRVQEQVRQLTAAGVIVTYPTQSVALEPDAPPFPVALYRRLEGRPRLVALYQRLFGAPVDN